MKYGISCEGGWSKEIDKNKKDLKKVKVLMRKGKEMTMKYDKVDRRKEMGLNKEIQQAKSSLFSVRMAFLNHYRGDICKKNEDTYIHFPLAFLEIDSASSLLNS